ncbi:hypothetical protein KCV04_g65, partial [Aureobasidium melanogenum]
LGYPHACLHRYAEVSPSSPSKDCPQDASGNSRKSPIPNFKSTFSTTTSRERRKRPTHITPPNRSSPIGTSLKTWSAIPAGSPSICRPFPTRMSRRRMEASLSNLLLNDCESEDMPRPNHFD